MSAALVCRKCAAPLTTENARRFRGWFVGACRPCESAESQERLRRRRAAAARLAAPEGSEAP